MSPSHESLVDRIHTTPSKGVIYTTGGGSGVLPILLRRGGGSATVLNAAAPHGIKAVPDLLGYDLSAPGLFPRAASPRVARGLAMAAFDLAHRLGDEPVFGVGCTCALSRGEVERAGRTHRLFAAAQTTFKTTEVSHVFDVGMSREDEESLAEEVVLRLTGMACGVDEHLPWPGETRLRTENSLTCGHPRLHELYAGRTSHLVFRVGNREVAPGLLAEKPRCILSGSLDPVHRGHVRMKAVSEETLHCPCVWELSVRNAAKPRLGYLDVRDRLTALAETVADGHLILSSLGTFAEKSDAFPNCTFAVGFDTAVRIADPRFYGGGPERDRCYAALAANGARFLVFGRVDEHGVFRNFRPALVHMDDATRNFFDHHATLVPEERFREDTSSSAVRDQ